jgi:Galactose mutarotase-like
VLLRTVAHRHTWPRGPFPPPPEEGSPREGRLRIEAVADAVLRVRYALGSQIRDGGDGMIVAAPPPPSSVEVAATADRVAIRTPAMSAVATLRAYGLEVRGAGAARLRIGGPDLSYFAVGDSLGTGVSQDLGDGRPVATETFGIGPGDALYPTATRDGFGETFLGLDKAGQTIDLWVSDAMGAHTPRLYKAVPFWLTTSGYGVFLHTSSRVTAWAGSRAAHQVQVAVDDDLLDYFIFLGAPAEVLAGYTALTGRAPLPPDWGEIDVAFRLGDSRIILEAKWTTDPISFGPVNLLVTRARQRLEGTIGIFASMAGYTTPALDQVSRSGERVRIVLFDAEHVEALISGLASPHELIDAALEEASATGRTYVGVAELLASHGSPIEPPIGFGPPAGTTNRLSATRPRGSRRRSWSTPRRTSEASPWTPIGGCW